MRERWRNVIGYEGLYKVSDWGRVRSLDRVVSDPRGGTRKLKGQILLGRPAMKNGAILALTVRLFRGGKGLNRAIHRIVLEAFVGPCPMDMEGCHNDGDPTNNAVSNLRYDSKENNELDKRKHGTHGGRPVRRSDGIEFISLAVAAEETDCNYQHIWAVCNNKRKTAGGYGWEYVENSI